ncbi:MAG TPA: molybdate ABC transporter permease subunit [Gammaproteobacteria bacterium]|nr:molybdate ABC transporter permease subunit [Gammaproteobacteria bacterium]
MDWLALQISLKLALVSTLILVLFGLPVARIISHRQFRGRALVESLIAMPLVLPPTVIGFYLLLLFNPDSLVGKWVFSVTGEQLVFRFSGLVVGSIVYSLPFALQPMIRAFDAIPTHLREAAWCSGLSPIRTFFKIELILALPGITTAAILSFAHTLGEFGVVLMLGGNIPGETRTLSIAIYDQVQMLNDANAHKMSLLFVLLALLITMCIYIVSHQSNRPSKIV